MSKSKAGRKPKYPWDKWLDGKSHTLQRDTHFAVERHIFYGLAFRSAKSRGLTLEWSKVGENGIKLRAV